MKININLSRGLQSYAHVDKDASPHAINRLRTEKIYPTYTGKYAFGVSKNRRKLSRSIVAALYGPDWQNAQHIANDPLDFRRSAFRKSKSRV